jgi:PAS domain S-box-containing protein
MLGYSIDEAVGNRHFWRAQICGREDDNEGDILDACFEDAGELRVEREVKSKGGDVMIFIDQATPRKDDDGRVKWIDGIMVDITELKKLQERALLTEEIRVSGEISARFAHEIRNPLATAGGFARRLRKALPDDDPNRKIAGIIVEEVARLEEILRITLSSIEPVTLCMAGVRLDELLRSLVRELEGRIREKGIRLEESIGPPIPPIQGDEGMLNRAFEALLRHSVISAPRGGRLDLAIEKGADHLTVTIRHQADSISEDDLEQFFFPRLASGAGSDALDLPLSKVIVHRHGGRIRVAADKGNFLVITVELPLRYAEGDKGIDQAG